jgi:hypothetical protein
MARARQNRSTSGAAAAPQVANQDAVIRGGATIEEFAKQVRTQSVQAQKALFQRVRGVSWESCHTPVSELKEITMLRSDLAERVRAALPAAKNFAKELRDAADKVVRAAYYDGDSHGYRIGQELFAQPEDFVVPGNLRAQAATENPRVPQKADRPELYSQLGLLYTDVPEFLAVALGALPDVPRSETQRIVDCSRPEVILTVKYYMERLTALGSRSLQRSDAGSGQISGVRNRERPNLLILPFGPAQDRIDSTYLPLFRELGFEPPRDNTGSLLFLRSKKPCADPVETPFPPQRICQFFSTVFPALRKTLHEDRGYRAESDAIQRLRTGWEAYRATALAGWTSVEGFRQIEVSPLSRADKDQAARNAEARNAEIIAHYGELLDHSLEHFAGSRHKERTEIYGTLLKMKEKLEESRTQRINPNPIILQIRGNESRSVKRNVDIRTKNGYNSSDENLLRATIRDGGERVQKLREALDRSPAIMGRPASIFDDRRLSREQVETQAAAILKDLGIPAGLLKYDHAVECSKVRPFTTFREALVPAFNTVKQEVANGRRSEAKAALARMRVVVDVCQADQLVQNLVGDLSDEGRPDSLASLVDKACTASNQLAQRAPLFGTACGIEKLAVGREAKVLFGRLAATMKDLQAQLVEMRKQDAERPGAVPDLEREKQFIESAKTILEGFDFERFLRRLAAG